MTHSVETISISLGNEPAEALGFKTEEQIERALIPLMAEVLNDKTISISWRKATQGLLQAQVTVSRPRFPALRALPPCGAADE